MNTKLKIVSIALAAVLLSACADDGDTGPAGPAGAQGPAGATGSDGVDGSDGADGSDGSDGAAGPSGGFGAFNVTVTNLTHGQPMAPSAIVVHEPGYNMFVSGQPASLGLEGLAEGGSPAMVLSEAQDAIQYLDAVSTAGINGPGNTTEVMTVLVPELDLDNVRLSVATMLVDTNDAFAGFNAVDISNMAVGDSMTFIAPAWDAGTEANTETAATMPGPAAGAAGGGGAAAGFDAARDDIVDAVRIHAGVVTNENAMDASMEGLSTSVLNQSDKFDNPTARVVISRTR